MFERKFIKAEKDYISVQDDLAASKLEKKIKEKN